MNYQYSIRVKVLVAKNFFIQFQTKFIQIFLMCKDKKRGRGKCGALLWDTKKCEAPSTITVNVPCITGIFFMSLQILYLPNFC